MRRYAELFNHIKMIVMKKQQSFTKRDVYQEVTQQVISALEQGHIIWKQGWNNLGLPKNIIAGNHYRGWNLFYLNFISLYKGYKTPYFITYKQAQDLGGNIRRGEKGYQIVYWALVDNRNETVTIKDAETGEEKEEHAQYRVPKFYVVFNIDQTEGIEFPKAESLFLNKADKLEACEQIIDNMPHRPQIRNAGDRAYYSCATDRVTMPLSALFHSMEEYYSTLFHELAHCTGHETRLNRKELKEHDGFGGENYSKEELTAELTAAFLCAISGIEQKTLTNSTAYIQGWLKALNNDKTLILKAASQSQAAADFILNHKTGAQKQEAGLLLHA